MDDKKRTRLLQRKQALWTERSDWETHWRDVSRYLLPRAGRFSTSDTNKGGKKDQHVIDSTGRIALRVLAAGMMSGVTSPARPWFRLGLPDKHLMEYAPVKAWLHRTAELLRTIFAKSNTYNALHNGYTELGAFGTWACPIVSDFEDIIHLHPLTVGEYALATDSRNRVDTLVREFKMTAAQLVEMFGKDACSETVRNMVDRGNYDAWVDVVHTIQPRKDRPYGKADNRAMPFASCYFEPGASDERYLSESGFKRFKVLAPRWDVTSNDVYGRSPGMDALGDVKQLQHNQLRKTQAIDLKVNPPLQVPTSLKDKANARMPGGVSYFDASGPGAGIRTAYEVNLDLGDMREDILDVRERVRSAMYSDLFLMLANDTRSGITATEVAERHEEKLIQLGPVLERLHNELLTPLIDITFDAAAETRILPPIPEELRDMELDVEFVSTLAQAQRAVAVGGMERFGTFVGQLAAAKGDPTVWDKVNTDQMVDDYADAMGVNPALVVDDDTAAEVRADRAQQMAAQQAAAAAPAMATAAKAASDIDVTNMQDVLGALQGYSAPVV